MEGMHHAMESKIQCQIQCSIQGRSRYVAPGGGSSTLNTLCIATCKGPEANFYFSGGFKSLFMQMQCMSVLVRECRSVLVRECMSVLVRECTSVLELISSYCH